MTPGVSYLSQSAVAAFAAVTGPWDANYPVTNLGDVQMPSQVGRATPTGGQVTFTFTLPAAALVRFIGLVDHNMAAAESVRVRLFATGAPDPATNGGAIVYDSTVVSVWPGGSAASSLFRPTRPFVLPAVQSVISGRVDITGLGGTLQVGGVEIGQFWVWPGEASGRALGFKNRLNDVMLAGGGAAPLDGFVPRFLQGELSAVALASSQTEGFDFQRSTSKSKAFVYVQDYDDPTSWARECVLMRQQEISALVGKVYRHDSMQIRFIEHWR